MPRRSSSGRSRRSGGSSSSRSSPVRNPPQQAAPSPPPMSPMQTRSVTGGIGSTIAEGMAFGGGSAMAHRAVDSIMGPRTIRHETVPSSAGGVADPTISANEACGNQLKAFTDCLNHYGSEINKCQFYMDMLSECRQSSTAGRGGGLNA